MRRIVALVALVLALTAGGARGETGTTLSLLTGTPALPSSTVPNDPGLVLPPDWLSAPAAPAQLSYGELLDLWRRAGDAYGVPWNVLGAINKIESDFGRNMGPSSAGAIGWMQFMPSTWLRWGTDATGDGVADPWDPVDAVYSAARYLAAAGAASDIRQAVFAYNHAWWYVADVMELAQLYGSSESPPADALQATAQPAAQNAVFTLDRLARDIDDAGLQVARAAAAYQVALEHAQITQGSTAALERRALSAPLLSDRLDAQRAAAQASLDEGYAQQEVDRLSQELDQARQRLDELREQAKAASFNRAAATLLATPQQAEGRWVFPVGGGPSIASVSHYHHDYPAADIAAPEGAPLYALSDGTVLYSWPDDVRCGTGFTMKTSDGQVWTYCHLSYLEPTVVQGARVEAGAPVGLVGHTGHATGPHLHLQLQPAASYPQVQPWFQSFAGAAFTWQEDGETKAGASAAPGPVFTILATD